MNHQELTIMLATAALIVAPLLVVAALWAWSPLAGFAGLLFVGSLWTSVFAGKMLKSKYPEDEEWS